MNMKQLFKALLLSGIVFMSAIMGADVHAQQDESKMNLRGIWQFKQAEYMEKSSPLQPYQVKHDINSVEGLYAYSACLQHVVKRAVFYNEEAIQETLFQTFIGKYYFITQPPSSGNKQSFMQFGMFEDLDKESTIQGRKFNSPGIRYKVEYIDESTIGIILEQACCDENFVITRAAIKCILKREK